MAAGKKKPEEKKADTSGIERSLRDGAEEQLARSPKPSPEFKGQTSEQFIYELQVHQIEIELQAEELRKSKIALEESRDKYLDLYEFAPIGYLTLNNKALITEVNLTGAKLLGVERDKIINHGLGVFIAPVDLEVWDRYFAEVRGNAKKQTCTLTLKRADGSVFPARLESSRITGGDGTKSVRIAISDITDIWQIEALKESECSYRGLFNTLRQAIYILNPDGTFVDVNEGAEVMYGYAKKEFIGRTPEFLSAPKKNDLPAVMEYIRKAFAGEPQMFEFWGLRKGGEQFPKDVCLYKGTYFGKDVVVAVGSDITKRKKAEEIIRMLSHYNRSLIDASLDPLVTISHEGRIMDVNAATERVTGRSRQELIGTDFSDYFVDPKKAREGYTSVFIDGSIHDYPLDIQHRDGHITSVLYNATVFRDENGDVLGVFAAARDITGRKKAEEALRESEEKYRALFTAESDGIFVVDKESGIIIDCNDAINPMYGYRKDEVIGQLNTVMSAEPNATRAATKEAKGLIPIRYHKRKDGSIFPVEITASVVSVKGQDVIIAAVRDITERKKIEEALALTSRKLALLSGITRHDIINQLSVLVGYLTILKKKQPDPTLNDYFLKVSTAAQHISSMVQFTKEYEKIGVDSPTWQDCRTLADTAAKQAPIGKIVLKNELPSGAEVFADPLVVKVFYNLMDNAVRYGGKISTIRFSVEEAGDEHLIVCEDDGDGIVVEEKEKIFERGFGKNTGLGLALAREILDITGITIKETSEPGKGARFEMTVPKGAYRYSENQIRTENVSSHRVDQ